MNIFNPSEITMEVFERPPNRSCGLRFEGARQMWKGTSTIGEALDEGEPSGALRKVSWFRHLSQSLFRNRRTHILWLQALSKAVETYGFDAPIPSPS